MTLRNARCNDEDRVNLIGIPKNYYFQIAVRICSLCIGASDTKLTDYGQEKWHWIPSRSDFSAHVEPTHPSAGTGFLSAGVK